MTKLKKFKSIFSNKDYESSDGMMTTIWGPSLWHSMHTISFNYPVNPTEKQKKRLCKIFLFIKRYVTM